MTFLSLLQHLVIANSMCLTSEGRSGQAGTKMGPQETNPDGKTVVSYGSACNKTNPW